MCDTLVYRDDAYTLFAKNSDREPNEPQEIVHIPAQEQHDKVLNCTYIRIPQASYTQEMVLSKPFQMWGAEMGVNKCSVVIGNEAVFTKIKEKKRNTGLTGMDMVRLGLERGTTAKEALHIIINLLESYGQDACGGYENKNFFYHNSFIIADKREAFKLETAARHWAYRQIEKSDSISNGLTIGSDFDAVSSDAIAFAYQKKWTHPDEVFQFDKAYGDKFMHKMTRCETRRSQTSQPIQANSAFDIRDAIKVLRSHHIAQDFTPSRSTARSVCMHPTGLLNPSQTNGSMIVKLIKGLDPEVWLTGTSMPCLSIYKPWSWDDPIDTGPRPGPIYDESLWWQAEKVHRMVCLNYDQLSPVHQGIFRGWQEEILNKGAKTDIPAIWSRHFEKLRHFEEFINIRPSRKLSEWPYQFYWYLQNRKVGL